MIINPYIFGGAPANLLLDDYPAHAGYSVRLLSNSYSGALVRIRRSSDNAEKDFYPDTNDELSLNSEDGASTSLSTWIGATNGYVVTWYDQSGNTLDLTQSTSSLQPRIVNLGVLETKGGIAAPFYGSGWRLNRAALTALAHSNNNTVVAVANHNTANTFGGLYTTDFSAVSSNFMNAVIDRRTQKRNLFIFNNSSTLYASNLSAQRDVSDQRLLFNIMDSSKNMSSFDNGATGSTDTYTGTYANTDFNVGARTGAVLTGNIQELIVWSSDQSGNRSNIETNINTYYSIY